MNRSPESEPKAPSQPIPPEYQKKLLAATYGAELGIADVLLILKKRGHSVVHHIGTILAAQKSASEDVTLISSQISPDVMLIPIEQQESLVAEVRRLGISLRDVVVLLQCQSRYMKAAAVHLRAQQEKELAETELNSPMSPLIAIELVRLQMMISVEGKPLNYRDSSPPMRTQTTLNFGILRALARDKQLSIRTIEGHAVEIDPSDKRLEVEVKAEQGNQRYVFVMAITKKGLCLELAQDQESLFS